MPKLLLITALLCGCSVRHLEGHDRYFEVCVDGEIEFHLELGNEEIACDSSPARSGQLRIKMAPSALSEMPTELGVEDLILVEWCSNESACLPATEACSPWWPTRRESPCPDPILSPLLTVPTSRASWPPSSVITAHAPRAEDAAEPSA